MPEKTKEYERVIFTPEVIKEAVSILVSILPDKDRKLRFETLDILLLSREKWSHDSEDEFFSDYRKGFRSAVFRKNYGEVDIIFHIRLSGDSCTRVSVRMSNRASVEKVFGVLEANVDKCRLPKQPKDKSKAETDWVNETISKIETHCPIVARKVRLALLKLESDDAEEWQNATMLIRDAWIELVRWLCQVNDVDTSDVPPDSVIDRLRKLKIDKTDERSFNLARASFNLHGKHHKRDIDLDTAVACVISTVVSMKTVVGEVFNAKSTG